MAVTRFFRLSPARLLAAVAALSVAPLSSAAAATATTSFQVTATVLAVCNIQATNLAFGSYSATNATPTDATSTINVTCSNNQSYVMSLDPGVSTGATVAARSMTSGSNLLSYGLYTTAARSTVWGDGTWSTATVGGTGNGALQAYTVDGRVRANQYVAAGSYTDTVTVSITY